jgi:hypothetical protein
VKVFIVGAGAAAHLAGVVAAHTTLPVIGVPIDSSALKGLDALLSTVQMPPGVPVATVAIGKPGATNAGVLAAQMIALGDPALAARLVAYKKKLAEKVEDAARRLEGQSAGGLQPAGPWWVSDRSGERLRRRRAGAPTMSCPQAARMSRPRLRRTDTVTPRSARIFANALTRSSDGRAHGMPGAALSGSRLTLALTVARTGQPPRILGVVHARAGRTEGDARRFASGKRGRPR